MNTAEFDKKKYQQNISELFALVLLQEKIKILCSI